MNAPSRLDAISPTFYIVLVVGLYYVMNTPQKQEKNKQTGKRHNIEKTRHAEKNTTIRKNQENRKKSRKQKKKCHGRDCD